MNKTMSDLLNQVDQLYIKLDAARPLLNKSILEHIDTEYTFDSNRIEGNTLTLRETEKLVHNLGVDS